MHSTVKVFGKCLLFPFKTIWFILFGIFYIIKETLSFILLLLKDYEPPVPVSMLPCARCGGKGVIVVGRTPLYVRNKKGERVLSDNPQQPIYAICPRCEGEKYICIYDDEDE